MSIKAAWNALIGKDNGVKTAVPENENKPIAMEELFPLIELPEMSLDDYEKIPMESISGTGEAFIGLWEQARTLTEKKTEGAPSGSKYYVAVNPTGIMGELSGDEYGINGNIMIKNAQGKNVIGGRMRFQEVSQLPGAGTLPIDPMMVVIAAALLEINHKLDVISEKLDSIIQFLKRDKQSKLRGDVKTINDIAEKFKAHCGDGTFAAAFIGEVLAIKREAYGNIEFYQSQIGSDLNSQKKIHINKDVRSLSETLFSDFREYSISCVLYAYSSFMDVMLRGDFARSGMESVISDLSGVSEKYDRLFEECRSALSEYQQHTLDSRFMAGAAKAVTGLGNFIGSIPVIRDGQADEKLIGLGNSLGEKNTKQEEAVSVFLNTLADNGVTPFTENLRRVSRMANQKDALLTDGEFLYVLK